MTTPTQEAKKDNTSDCILSYLLDSEFLVKKVKIVDPVNNIQKVTFKYNPNHERKPKKAFYLGTGNSLIMPLSPSSETSSLSSSSSSSSSLSSSSNDEETDEYCECEDSSDFSVNFTETTHSSTSISSSSGSSNSNSNSNDEEISEDSDYSFCSSSTESIPSDLENVLDIIVREEDRELYNSRFVKYCSSFEYLPGNLPSFPIGTLIQLDQDTPNVYLRKFIGKRIYEIRGQTFDSSNNIESITISHVYSPLKYRLSEPFFLDWEKYDKIQDQ